MRTFTCPSCRKKFAWKDEYLNRKVTCRCGRVFEPLEDLSADLPVVDPYDIAEDDPSSPPAATEPLAASPAAPLTPYPARLTKAAMPVSAPEEASRFRDLVLPSGLLVLGMGIMIALGLYGVSGESNARAIALNAVFLLLMILTMMGGGAIAGVLLGVDFGPIGRVAFKFAGTGAFTAAVALTVVGLDKSDSMTGPIVAWHLVVVLYWICFYLLFDLDLLENLVSVAIIAFMQAAVACILWSI